jgi:hypothetical protein
MYDLTARSYFPRAGSIVSWPITRTPYRHYVIVSDQWYREAPMLISFVPAGVTEIPWHSAGEGPWLNHGYPSDLAEWEVLYRARNYPGQPYDLALRNCEYHVRYAHNLEAGSHQVTTTVLVAAAVASLVWLANK